ncbi:MULTISPECIES: PAS domain-containing protein [unclassified Leptolyngbya]|uniref:PAS domain-containing protein n=1 Tax=unclassified Leptolyngbya TaxID=2650499 RepID=UPI00168351DF|nr:MULTISPECIES: PAS domain-containing protein [unclassified Leptolyngbya]MBD1909803.1 PAS domain-containing protein [Leptolyngbya sp. FACHB-8]MBD2158954.1 PAS domain-containing protein [Leptolyngbya sp. FACHB-16]
MSCTDASLPGNEHSILEHLTDGVAVLDSEWVLTYLNRQQAEWFGVPKADALGKPIWEIDPAWNCSEVRQPLQQAMTTQTPLQLEYVCPKRQNWFELRVSPTGTGLTILAIDITSRKQAEAGLRDSQSRFLAFMNHSPVSAWIVGESGHLLYLNSTYLETFYFDEDVTGKHISEIFEPEIAQQFLKNNQQVFETGQALQTIEHTLSPDGSIRSFLVCKFPIFHESGEKLLGGVAVDISEQKRTEAALRESEHQLRLALRTAKLGSWQYDLTTNTLTCSEQCKANVGLPADAEFTHEILFTALHPEDRDRVQAAIHRSITEHTDYEVEERCFHPDGSLHWLIARGGLIFDDEGNPSRLVGVTLDITERKQFEESLKAANQRVSNILESITDAFIAFDPEWHYTYVNQEAAKLLGRPVEELLGKKWQDVFPELAESRTLFSQQMEKVMVERATVHFEGFSPVMNRWVEASIFPATPGISVFFRDISQRKQEERRKALQYSISQILAEATTLVDVVPALLQSMCQALGWQVGLIWRTDRTDSILHFTNSWTESTITQRFIEASQRITFIPGTGLPGQIWRDRQPRWIEDLTQDTNFLRGKAASEAGLKAGFAFPILLGDDFFGVIECFSDRIQSPDADLLQLMAAIGRQIGQFMERKQTEAALRESEELFQSFMSHSPVAAYIKDESGRYVYVNTLIEQLFDRPATELIGHTDADWFPAEAIEQIRAHDAAVLAKNEALQILETVPFSDQVRHFMAFKFPLQDASGRRLLGGVSADITDRVQAEEERERLLAREKAAREQAESANRIKDEFLAVLSHELRSPLNPILGWSKLLQQGTLDAQTHRRALETIERNARLQTQLIDDLLDVSRILQGKLSLSTCSVNLVGVVEAAIETVRLAAEAKHIQIHTDIALEDGRVLGDATRLQQIVWNLLSNAVKFTPEGGRVNVSVEKVTGQSSSVANQSSGSLPHYVQIRVSDTGKGINPTFLPYVFDYFRQEDGKTTRQFGGLGLGLAIARHLTELHGGKVDVESPGESQGSTFTVQLPVMSLASTSTDTVSGHPQSIDLSELRILVVDDDEDMRALTQVILEQQGAQVSLAASAAEVLQLFDHHPPDIFISDIGMPEVDGYMLMRQIRNRAPDQGGLVPAIALTAYAGEHDQQLSLKVGFQQHVAKPVEPEELVRAIATLVRRS